MSKQQKIIIIFFLLQTITPICDPNTAINLPLLGQTVDAETVWYRRPTKGIGSFGEVRSVIINDKEYAMKKIIIGRRKTSDEFQELLDLTLHEIETLRNLSSVINPNFPVFYGCGMTETKVSGPMTIYVIQESLYSDLKPDNAEVFINNVPPKNRLGLYLELAEGLAMMHSKNYVHEDLKPDNIMTNIRPKKSDIANLHFKIIDFGLTYKTTENFKGGTVLYNAPEKVNYDTLNKFEHDIWAFGLTVSAIEAKQTYLFNGINNECFFTNFTQECGTKLYNNVENIMNKVFGRGSKFTELIKETVSYNKDHRPNAENLAKAIRKIIQDGGDELENENMRQTVNYRNSFDFNPQATQAQRKAAQKRIFDLSKVNNRKKFEMPNNGNDGINEEIIAPKLRHYLNKDLMKKIAEKKILQDKEGYFAAKYGNDENNNQYEVKTAREKYLGMKEREARIPKNAREEQVNRDDYFAKKYGDGDQAVNEGNLKDIRNQNLNKKFGKKEGARVALRVDKLLKEYKDKKAQGIANKYELLI